MMVGGITTIFVWTGLFVSGIEWKDWKEIWVTFVLFTVGNLVMMQIGQKSTMGAKIWYLWDAMESTCEMDEDGNCVWEEDQDPWSVVMGWKEGEEGEMEDDWDM